MKKTLNYMLAASILLALVIGFVPTTDSRPNEGKLDLQKVREDQHIHFLQKAVDQKKWTDIYRAVSVGMPTVLVVFPDKILKGDPEILFEILLLLESRPEKLWVLKYGKKPAVVRSGDLLIITIKKHKGMFYQWNDDIESQYLDIIRDLSLNPKDKAVFEGDY